MLGRLVVSKVVEQNRAQNRALRFYVRRKSADAVVSGRHVPELNFASISRPSISEETASHQMICAEAVNPAVILWKPRENRSITEGRRNATGILGLSAQIRADPCKSVANMFPKKQMRPGPATRAA